MRLGVLLLPLDQQSVSVFDETSSSISSLDQDNQPRDLRGISVFDETMLFFQSLD